MEDDNFQTLNIKYKLKKIKNKRKNMQNIEPFETLNNIPDTTEQQKTGKKVVEGLQTIQDSDYEGLDDVISQAEKEESIIAHALTDVINRVYIALITFNCLIAFSIANSTRKGRPGSDSCGGDVPIFVEYTNPRTGKEEKKMKIDIEYMKSIIEIDYGTIKYGQVVNTEPITGGNENLDPGLIKDANAVYRYICLFEAVTATFLFTFVWFYIIFYCYSNNIKNESVFNLLNREELRKNTNVFVKILFFVFEFGIRIFEDMRWFFETRFPEYALYFNRPFCFLLLFLLILDMNHKYLSYFKDLLIDIIHVNGKNFFVVILYLVLIYEIFNFWIFGAISSAKKAESENPLDQASFLITAAVKIMPLYLNPYSAIPVAIYKFIKELVRMIIALAISVPVGALLCISYFLYLSLVFPLFNIVFKKDFVQTIYNFIRSEGVFSGKDPCDIPVSFWDKILDNVGNMFSYLCITIFNLLPYLVLILFSAYYIRIHLLDGMDCPGTSKFLQGINFTILGIGILGLVWHFREILTIITTGGTLTLFTILVVPPMTATLGLIGILINIILFLIFFGFFINICYSIAIIDDLVKKYSKEAETKVREKAAKVQSEVSSNTPGA